MVTHILILFICCIRTLRHGMHDLKVWPDVEADGKENSSTPGETTLGKDKMSHLAKVV